MYKVLVRPLLFLFAPEVVHRLAFALLKICSYVPGVHTLFRALFTLRDSRLERKVLGLTFPNPVGLAAGFDKNAELVSAWSSLGFGFVEVGTVTPIAQPGNPEPRLFRLPADHALINRMGFNNDGARAVASRIPRKRPLVVGGNIGKNKSTPNESATGDYLKCVEALYDHVDYFVVNVSSPNTPGLRQLQDKEPLRELLMAVKKKASSGLTPRPVLLKIAPDLTREQVLDIVEVVTDSGTDGVIVSNTTLSRDGLATPALQVSEIGAGGLSGKPLTHRSTDLISFLRKAMGPGIVIIGVGGIMTPGDALDKLKAGADLVQVYTGFVYEGPSFARHICREILRQSADKA
jgi:dihydroorotate dehydrogenase